MFFAHFLTNFSLRYSLHALAKRPSLLGLNPAKILTILGKLEGQDVVDAQERIWLLKIWVMAEREYRSKDAHYFQWHRVMAECSSLSRRAEDISISVASAASLRRYSLGQPG